MQPRHEVSGLGVLLGARADDALLGRRTRRPSRERQARGADLGGVFVARRHEFEHLVGGVLLEGQVAALVDDDQPVAAQPGELGGEPTEAVGSGESGDPVRGGGRQGARLWRAAMRPSPAATVGDAVSAQFDVSMIAVVIERVDPRDADVAALLERHVSFARSSTPAEFAFALDVGALVDPTITVVAAREHHQLLAVGALREIGAEHGELKSMHTAPAARGRGIGAAIVDHLVGLARERGYVRVSLETGSRSEFRPARDLYARAGFIVSGPFADYPDSPYSVFMTKQL